MQATYRTLQKGLTQEISTLFSPDARRKNTVNALRMCTPAVKKASEKCILSIN